MKSSVDQTRQSLRRISDFPFYTATYNGSYKIHDFKDGAIRSDNDVIPFFEDLFYKAGLPTKLSTQHIRDDAQGCSAFFCRDTKGHPIVGKNNDWKRDPIILLKTSPEEGFSSLSMVDLSFCDLFRLDSLQHNLLLAPYLPLDGMNEKGLIVTTLSVNRHVEYPIRPGKPSVGDFNIVRIILDFCASVDEAIDILSEYNIMQSGPFPIHMLIADEERSCIVEFFDGKLHLLKDSDISYLTNFLKMQDSEYNRQRNMCSRYQTLERELVNADGQVDRIDAMRLLEKVSVFTAAYQMPSTIWSLVYNPRELTLTIKIGRDAKHYVASVRN